jgi:hypothetical protein
MNFITTNHRGGLGNVMFKLAAVISMSIDNGVNYLFSKEYIRPVDPNYDNYDNNILRNINFIDKLPENLTVYTEPQFNYKEINYEKGTNLLIDGYFQSEKYFINNKQTIINLYKPTDEIKNQIISVLPNIGEYTSIHVRRGDYLKFPNHHPQQSKEYYQEAIDIIGIDKPFIIFSDDLGYVKNMFDFLPNKIFYTSGQDWLDLYTMSLCCNNIICNSTFSWWGAYLNQNKNKIVIANNKWFGPAYSNYDVSTLLPPEWVVLNK